MIEKIRQERRQDPEGIPDNAEGIVEAIVKQEMERVMTSVKATRAKERLLKYQYTKMSDFNHKDFSDTTDAVVEQILKEAAEDWERRDKCYMYSFGLYLVFLRKVTHMCLNGGWGEIEDPFVRMVAVRRDVGIILRCHTQHPCNRSISS
jgi:hypothetical protein